MSAVRYHEADAMAAFDRHAALARQEKADPTLVDDQKFQRKRRRAYKTFLSAFSRGAA